MCGTNAGQPLHQKVEEMFSRASSAFYRSFDQFAEAMDRGELDRGSLTTVRDSLQVMADLCTLTLSQIPRS